MKEQQPRELPYADRPELTEVFADQVRIIHWDGYSIRLEFVVNRPHVSGPNQVDGVVYPNARIVLSPITAAVFSEHLSMLLSRLEKEGVLKRVAPSSDKRQ